MGYHIICRDLPSHTHCTNPYLDFNSLLMSCDEPHNSTSTYIQRANARFLSTIPKRHFLRKRCSRFQLFSERATNSSGFFFIRHHIMVAKIKFVYHHRFSQIFQQVITASQTGSGRYNFSFVSPSTCTSQFAKHRASLHFSYGANVQEQSYKCI